MGFKETKFILTTVIKDVYNNEREFIRNEILYGYNNEFQGVKRFQSQNNPLSLS